MAWSPCWCEVLRSKLCTCHPGANSPPGGGTLSDTETLRASTPRQEPQTGTSSSGCGRSPGCSRTPPPSIYVPRAASACTRLAWPGQGSRGQCGDKGQLGWGTPRAFSPAAVATSLPSSESCLPQTGLGTPNSQLAHSPRTQPSEGGAAPSRTWSQRTSEAGNAPGGPAPPIPDRRAVWLGALLLEVARP